MAAAIDIAERIVKHFPVGDRPLMLEIVSGATGKWIKSTEPTAVATIRLIVWDTDLQTGAQSIRDIKEQELDMGWPVLYDDEDRVAAFFAAFDKLLRLMVERGVDFDPLMPSDLVHADALALARARSVDDFEAALRAKSRLGALLG